jgi:geranylgeranyl pyrophosphate synthase
MTAHLENVCALVDEKLIALFQDNTPLYASTRYALQEGKRLRPMLLLGAALAYDVSIENALLPAIAWELVHTYSLAHDDLPCMDDDDERRGRPTLHRAFPEWQAVLTGDFLLTYAFELIATAPELEDSVKLKLITLLACSSGSKGMVGGQMLDLSLAPGDTDWLQLESLHRKKTGALFSSALEAGGWLGHAPAEDCARLALIGEAFGLWYQIADDLADGESETPSALTTLGKERAKELIEELKTTTLTHLNALSVPAPLIKSILGVAL